MSSTYNTLLAEHAKLPSFSGYIPSSILQPLAGIFLSLAFISTFYFTTLKSKGFPIQEIWVGGIASLIGGFGLVFAFCAVGVNV